MSIKQITSDTIIPIEEHFRVSAGPGAGKTHWLVNHINNVLFRSSRLSKFRKIACITYTNIAVETIVKRLGDIDDNVIVDTIHSFLYKNVLKPYASFLPSEYTLNVEKLDGHDDVILSNYSFLSEWKVKTHQQRIRDDYAVVKAFEKMRWRFDNSGNLIVRPDYPMQANGYALTNASYFEYKKMAWAKGVVHHDDVLYLSHQLINKYPFILTVLRAKFPYFFVDEFQDTNPIQTKILEQIGQQETIIGIIGDKAQSIYKFQGACPEQFDSFNLPYITDYKILDNRRSTVAIVKLLNSIRNDLNQNSIRGCEGNRPLIIIGPMINGIEKCKDLYTAQNIVSLSRTNTISNSMKKQRNGILNSSELINGFYSSDSNYDRKKIILGLIKATELARESNYENSIKEIARIFYIETDKQKRKKIALYTLKTLLSEYDEYKDGSLYNYYCFIKSKIIPELAKITNRGAAKAFYDRISYHDFSTFVKIDDDYSRHRTVHKAKGAEFEAVYLVLEEESDLEFLLNPNMNNEEHRINYVAVSRAMDNLIINVPSLSTNNRSILQSKNFNIVET
jgi:DNA helicase-2/ATP-dependent DNA helicase PcrA